MKKITVYQLQSEELDALVKKHYGKRYQYSQQGSGEARTNHVDEYKIPDSATDFPETDMKYEDYIDEYGVSLETWLETEPDAFDNSVEPNGKPSHEWQIDLWWEANFYPDAQMLLNDMAEKGYIPEGDYQIMVSL